MSSRTQRKTLLVGIPLELAYVRVRENILCDFHSFDKEVTRSSSYLAQLSDIERKAANCGKIGSIDLRIDASEIDPVVESRLDSLISRANSAEIESLVVHRVQTHRLAGKHFVDYVRYSAGDAGASLRRSFGWLKPGADDVLTIFPFCDYSVRLEELCVWINNNCPFPASLQATLSYYQICQLHAFEDGNGRLAKAICSLILSARLIQADRSVLPINAICYANRTALIDAFRRSYASSSLDYFLTVFLALLEKSRSVAVEIARTAQRNFPSSSFIERI